MSTFTNDIKFAFRQLRKTPGMTAVALVILALGLGANVTMFGFVHTYLLKPLPFAEADRLVALRRTDPENGGRFSVHWANFLDWQQRNQSFESLACYHDGGTTLNGPGTPEKLQAMHVTAELLPMLGVEPVMGRLFTSEDDREQATKTVMISHGLWQRRFGSTPEIVGQSIELDGQSASVIGVLPASFSFPPWSDERGDIWQPLQTWIGSPGNGWFKHRGNSGSTAALGKLKPGVTLAQARLEMDKIAADLRVEYPQENHDAGVYLGPLQDYQIRDIKPVILLLVGAVAFVMLIVCINLAHLLLVRSTARLQEFSVRCALGAGRGHIVRQIVSESSVLVLLGGAGGLLLAFWGSRMLEAVLPAYLQAQGQSVTLLSGPGLLFVFGLLLVTTCISSLASILHLSQENLAAQIRSQTRSATPHRRGQGLRDTLVVAEMALAMILLVGAGLLLNSFMRYLHTDPGYNPERVISMRLSLPNQRDSRESFCTQLLHEVNALAGVKHAGLSSSLLHSHSTATSYDVEGAPSAGPEQHNIVRHFEVTPEFFPAMGMRLLQGRFLNEQDMASKGDLIVVNQVLADKWWPNRNPLGQRLRMEDTWLQIVGVVAPVKHYGADQESRPCLYYTGYRWWPVGDDRTLVVRTQQNPTQIVAPIRKIVSQLDASVPLYEVQTVREIASEQSRLRRVSTAVLGGFAAIALLLSALGIYGVLAYSVSQRTQEIGIRMALGARVNNILRTVIAHGLKLTLVGIVLGLCGSLALSRLLESHLYGVGVYDPVTFGLVTIVLSLAALLACFIPARRAAKIDPMEALRYE